jgi:hypothetical protein
MSWEFKDKYTTAQAESLLEDPGNIFVNCKYLHGEVRKEMEVSL